MRLAVSKSTCAPSTAASRMARGAGIGAPLSCLLQQRRERRQDAGQRGAGRGAAGHLVALLVPRLGVASGLALIHALAAGTSSSTEPTSSSTRPVSLACAGLNRVPWRQHVHERVLDAEHPHGAGDAAAAGQQAQRHLGEADDEALDVGGDAVVTRQRDLQAAAERGAVDGGDDRLAEGLQRAQVPLDALDGAEELACVLRLGLDHALEVTAGEEGLLRAGDDDAGDRILLGDKAFDGVVHRLAVVLVHHVGRAGRVVQRQGDDAVGILVPLNGVLCHGLKPSR